MRSLAALLAVAPLIAGCAGGAADTVHAGWADYETAAGPGGDLVAVDLRMDYTFSLGGSNGSLALSGGATLHDDGFQYRLRLDDVRRGGEAGHGGPSLDITCSADGLRVSMDGQTLEAEREVTDCWDAAAVAQAVPDALGFDMGLLTHGVRGGLGDMRLTGAEVTADGTVGTFAVGPEGVATVQVLVDAGRVRHMDVTIDQSIATMELVMDMRYGERSTTPPP